MRGTVPKVRSGTTSRTSACTATTPPAWTPCPVEGAIYKRDDGLVIIDPDKCTGCKTCVDACPYDAIYFNEDLNLAQKCTGCAHLLDDGWNEPALRRRLPDPGHQVRRGERARRAHRQGRGLEARGRTTKPRVYYLNLPKKFIAGTVYDPVEKEVVIGATCTLTPAAGGAALTVATDEFGDFWFEGSRTARMA